MWTVCAVAIMNCDIFTTHLRLPRGHFLSQGNTNIKAKLRISISANGKINRYDNAVRCGAASITVLSVVTLRFTLVLFILLSTLSQYTDLCFDIAHQSILMTHMHNTYFRFQIRQSHADTVAWSIAEWQKRIGVDVFLVGR
jgi:hypothetical protein